MGLGRGNSMKNENTSGVFKSHLKKNKLEILGRVELSVCLSNVILLCILSP